MNDDPSAAAREVLTNEPTGAVRRTAGPQRVATPQEVGGPLRGRRVAAGLLAALVVTGGLWAGLASGHHPAPAGPTAPAGTGPSAQELRPFGQARGPRATVALPVAWQGWPGGVFLPDESLTTRPEGLARLTVAGVLGVATAPCGGGFRWTAATAREMARQAAGIPRITVARLPRRVSAFGGAAWHLRLRGDARTACAHGLGFGLWVSPWGVVWFRRPDVTVDAWFVDVPGGVLVVEALRSRDLPAWRGVELDRITASLRIHAPLPSR
jgi:hypothetical protein